MLSNSTSPNEVRRNSASTLLHGDGFSICSARKCSIGDCATSHSILAAMLSLSPDLGAAQDRDHLLTEQGDRLGPAPIHRAPKDRQKVAGPAAAALLDD